MPTPICSTQLLPRVAHRLRRFWRVWQDVIILASILLTAGVVWKILDGRGYPFREGRLPKGWHWVERPMSPQAFFESEGIEPTKLRGVTCCFGAVQGYSGPASGFADYLKGRLPGEAFQHWTKFSYSWDARGWRESAPEINETAQPLLGLVVLREAGDTEPLMLPNDFRGGAGYSEYWGWSWEAPPPNTGIWQEIDARYGAEYSVVCATHHDIDQDQRRMRIRSRKAGEWLEAMQSQMLISGEPGWPDCFMPGPRWNGRFTLNPHAGEVEFVAVEE